MPRPSVVVEFRAPGGSTWNNITSYVQSVNIDRGGDRDISEFSAGSLTVVLFNRNRQFDPKYSSGFYTQIKPIGNIRVTATGSAISGVRFFGYITAWNFTYDVEGNSYAIVSASDGLSEIAKKTIKQYTPPSEPSGVRINNVLSRPEVNWPSADRNLEGGSALYDYEVPGGTNALSYIQQCASSEGGIFFCDRQGRLTYLDTGSTGSTTTTSRTNLILNPSAETNATGWNVGTRTTAVAKFGSYSVLTVASSTQAVNYSQPGQGNSAVYTASAWVYAVDTAYREYRITANCLTSGGASLISTTSATFELIGVGWQQISVTFTGGGSTWTGADSLEIIVSAVDSATAGFYVDGLMLEQTSAMFDYFDGTSRPANTPNVTYTSVWNGTANASTSTMTIVTTFSNITPGSFAVSDVSGIDYVGVEVAYGAETLYNRVVLDWPWRPDTLQPIIVQNTTSQSTYGIKTLELTDNLLNDTTLRTNRANAALTALKDPEFRINSITIAQHDQTAAQNDTLVVQDIGSTANVTFTPNKVGSAISPTGYTVIGISESITADTYETTYYLSADGSLGRVGGAGGRGLE